MDLGTRLAEIISTFVTDLLEAILSFLEELFAALANGFQ